MNINEMVSGRVYKCNDREYKMTGYGLLEKKGSWWYMSHIPYNKVIEMNFKEVPYIPDENTPINSIVKVRNSENDRWEHRIFCCYLPVSGWKFVCFDSGNSQNMAISVTQWKYCEIIKEGEVK